MTKPEYRALDKAAARIDALGLAYGDRISILMDLEFSKIDIDRLMTFDDFNFTHDITGIRAHFNRETMRFGDCFLPRAGLKA